VELNLTGKVAIIKGASRGIGKSIAQTLSAEGMNLTLIARSPLDEFSASLPTENLPLSIDMRHADKGLPEFGSSTSAWQSQGIFAPQSFMYRRSNVRAS